MDEEVESGLQNIYRVAKVVIRDKGVIRGSAGDEERDELIWIASGSAEWHARPEATIRKQPRTCRDAPWLKFGHSKGVFEDEAGGH